jgi:hypothetical protein
MDGKSPGRGTVTGNVLWGLLAACCVMIVIGGIVPLSQPRIPMNHMRAANSSVQLIAAERQYTTRFPATGFTCDLGQLAQAGLVDTVLASGDKAGYHYELHGCNTTGTASVFSFTAVPIAPDRTGKSLSAPTKRECFGMPAAGQQTSVSGRGLDGLDHLTVGDKSRLRSMTTGQNV